MPLPALDTDRHTAGLVAVLLTAVAIVGLGTGVLIGWAGGGAAEPDRASVLGAKTTSGGSTTGTGACAPPPVGRRDLGFFVGAREEPDGVHVSFDRALLFVGADARRQARVYGLEGDVRHGTLLVNENPLLRDRVLAPDVRICGLEGLAGSDRPTPVSEQQLLAAVGARGSTTLLDLTYDSRGRVADVRERDLP